MKSMTRGLLGLFLAGLTAALLLAVVTVVMSALSDSGSQKHAGAGGHERIFVVNVKKLVPTRTTPMIETFGEVVSGRTLELRAASSGTLVQMADSFREGGVVHKGELLFQTDPATAKAKAALATTALEDAKAELSEAQEALGISEDELRAAQHQYDLRVQVLERQKSLRKRGVGTETAQETAALAASAADQAALVKRQALANAKFRINRAKIALARSQINATEARRILAETSQYAKFDGVLSDVTGDLGGLVNANERLARLIDPTALEVAFRVSNAEFLRLTGADKNYTHTKVSVTFGGQKDQITAMVDRVNAAVGVGQTGRELYALLDPVKAINARPGDFVSILLQEPALENVAVLPATAASAMGEVLILGKGDRLEAKKVKILRKQGNQIIIALGNLAGREVVLERAPQLGVGIKVKVRPNGGAIMQSKPLPKTEG